MLYLIATVLGVLLGIVFKGKLSNLLNIRLEKVWIVILAFVVQTLLRVLTLNGLGILSGYGLITHCIVYGLLLVGFWFNRHYAGMCIMGLGCFSNALVMALSGGKMPVSVEALAKAQITGVEDILQAGMDGKHVILDESTRLYFLADIINLPPVLGAFMPVVSIGDLIIAAGIFLLAFCGVKGAGLK